MRERSVWSAGSILTLLVLREGGTTLNSGLDPGAVAPLATRRPGRDNRAMSDHAISREEVDAAIAARKELGEELEPAVVDAFVERIEQRIAARRDESERAIQRRRNHQKEMILGGMGISVPLLLIAAVFTGLPGVIAVCVALIALGVVVMRDDA